MREAYREKGWAFRDGSDILQCQREGYSKKVVEQLNEGCRLYGYLEVNKVRFTYLSDLYVSSLLTDASWFQVAGNVHIAPGRSFSQNHVHGEFVADLSRFHIETLNNEQIFFFVAVHDLNELRGQKVSCQQLVCNTLTQIYWVISTLSAELQSCYSASVVWRGLPWHSQPARWTRSLHKNSQ